MKNLILCLSLLFSLNTFSQQVVVFSETFDLNGPANIFDNPSATTSYPLNTSVLCNSGTYNITNNFFNNCTGLSNWGASFPAGNQASNFLLINNDSNSDDSLVYESTFNVNTVCDTPTTFSFSAIKRRFNTSNCAFDISVNGVVQPNQILIANNTGTWQNYSIPISGLISGTNTISINQVTGITSIDVDYAIDSIQILADTVCCNDEPYIEPFWALCDSSNLCALDTFPIRVLDDDGTPLLQENGYSFVWSTGNTGSVYNYASPNIEYTVTVTYPDGCVYTIKYIKECCVGGITVEFEECPPTSDIIMQGLWRQLQSNKGIFSNSEYKNKLDALNQYETSLAKKGSDAILSDDCDPCVVGQVIVFIIDETTGLPITNFESITVLNNSTGGSFSMNTDNYYQATVDQSYTITVVVDEDGHKCEYTYTFTYECEEDCVATMPTGLHCVSIDGVTYLSWNAVPGADHYLVYIELNTCCKSTRPQMSLLPITVIDNKIKLSDINLGNFDCFRWRVKSVCPDGTTSFPTKQHCYNRGQLCKSIITKSENVTLNDEKSISAMVFPNPNQGTMTFRVGSETDTDLTINIFTIDGSLVQSFRNEISAGTVFEQKWDARGILKAGVYLVSMTTNNATSTQKIIVE